MSKELERIIGELRDRFDYHEIDDIVEDLEQLKEPLNRLEPKKLRYIHTDTDYYGCPSCPILYTAKHKHVKRYCAYCGQKLDWGD